MKLLGTGVAPGVAIGPALLVERALLPVFRVRVAPEQVEEELARLRTAVDAARQQLEAIRLRLEEALGPHHSYLFDAQLLMLEDPLLIGKAEAAIREQGVNAEWALRDVGDRLHGVFESLGDPYLRERRTDLDDVIGRVLQGLAGREDAPSLSRLPSEVVLVAPELRLSQVASLDWARVLAVVTDSGSHTHHAAILARSLGVPAVVGLGDVSRRVTPGSQLVVDGSRGEVIVDAEPDRVQRYRVRAERERRDARSQSRDAARPAVTADGVAVELLANAEFPDEVGSALRQGARGIGLFRSEYLLARRRAWPDEEEQLAVYTRLVEAMRPFPVTVRTFDVGPEDLGPEGPSRANPALGERALRLLRTQPDPFRIQMRALLRAATKGPLRISFPFVAGPADLAMAMELLEEARRSLVADGLEFDDGVPVGLNIEVPSAAVVADVLARQVAFFSVGTNDLIQYLLAVDRSDPRVAPFYQPLHLGVVRTLDAIARAAQGAGIGLSVCGEMAADPLHALLLLGQGYRELSMNPSAIPRVEATLRRVDAAEAARVARVCQDLGTAEEVEQALRSLSLKAETPGPAVILEE